MITVYQLIDCALNWLRPPDEESETPETEEPMTKSELIRTLLGLLVIDALFTFSLRYWADHDPRAADPFMYWFIIPMVSVLATVMAALQLYWYKHPNQADEYDEEGNS
jgi:hypothetical protein